MGEEKPNPSGRFDAGEEKLMQVAKLAEAGLSLAAVIHEVRQPLSALKMALQLIRDKVGSGEDLSGYLSDALQQTGRIADFMERTRDFLSPPQGVSELDASEVLAGVLSMLKWQLGRKGIQLEVDLNPGLPRISADRTQLEQLFFNLVNNAKDAVVAGRGSRIVLIARGSGSGGVEVVIADDGTGILPEISGRVFDAFFTTKGRNEGTGLGLYIARQVAKAHGGDISLLGAEERERLGRGRLSTAFRVRFPAVIRMSMQPPPAPAAGATRRALIVDDEDVVRRLVAKIVSGEGYECSVAATGEEALEALDEGGLDLLITDKNLPGVSGIEVARLARNLYPQLPIVIITGYASQDSAATAASIGVADYVIKPIDVADFRGVVRRVRDGGKARPDGVRRPGPPPKREESEPRRPREGATRGREEAAVDGPIDVSVLLVEPNSRIRDALSMALVDLGCKVAAFSTDKQAEVHARRAGFEVLLANADTLRNRRDRLMSAAAGKALGAIAIMDRAGVDKAIEAIHLGARGVISPPFERGRIAHEFRRSVGRLFEDRRARRG